MSFEIKKHELSDSQKRNLLESATFHYIQSNEFSGGLLQEFNMRFTSQIPTAMCSYNPKDEQFEIALNPDLFASCDILQRVAVLSHEVMHFAHQHLFRLPWITASPEERMVFNIAGDMAINQFIPNLPPLEGIVKVEDYKLNNGKPFPKFRTMEEYYQLIKNNQNEDNRKVLGKYGVGEGKPAPFDVHDWDQLPDEDKQQMLEKAKKMIERTIEKTSFGRSSMPDIFKDLLEDIKTQIAKINYRDILNRAIKKTLSAFDRERTWHRPNKRYGVYAPGSRNSRLPNLGIYADTSGSISYNELNSFLNVGDNFLKVGTKTCNLALWHTEVYKYKKYRNNIRVGREEVEGGGTDINCVFSHINKHRCDLAIILTDGEYGDSPIKPNCEIIWLISHNSLQHPFYKKIGKTISLEGVING